MDMYFEFVKWEQIFEVIHYRRNVGFENAIEYVIHSNEQGHNEPHIHVKHQNKEVVINLKTFEVIEGNIKSHQLKTAKLWVQNNQPTLQKYWNELTNGVKIPVL